MKALRSVGGHDTRNPVIVKLILVSDVDDWLSRWPPLVFFPSKQLVSPSSAGKHSPSANTPRVYLADYQLAEEESLGNVPTKAVWEIKDRVEEVNTHLYKNK